MSDTSKEPRVLYLSEGTSCPEQEWSDEPRCYGDEPYTPFVPYSDYQSLLEQCEKLEMALENHHKNWGQEGGCYAECFDICQALEEFKKFKGGL